ncbi:MAG TPA: PIN domain-containing protein [Candidatus Nanoarchaeia archaeon]|nr:PIN domain-containing protein [Candidatus Nanoarchaeia archaeon]
MTLFVDTNVLIKAFTDNEDRGKCRNVLREEFVTNTLCLVEAEHAISIITADKQYASDCMKSLFKSSGVIVPLDKELLFQSSRLLKHSKLNKLNRFDLIHYSTALINGCTEIISYDKHFDGLPLKRTEP